MTGVRATQQVAAYAAQAVVPVGRTFESLDAIQDLLDGLRDEPLWPERITRVEVGPAYKTGRVGATAGWFADRNAGRIEFKPSAMNELIVCHELAHVIAHSEGNTFNHDPWWARRFTELVYRVMGSDAWVALTTALREHGVDYG